MVNRLGLAGNDLLVYAVIYGFSQDDESAFKGSMAYLAGCVNVSKRAVFDVLNRLIKKGLIIKEETVKNGQKYCNYRTPKDPPSIPPNPQKGGSAASSYPMQNLHGGYAESARGGGANSAPHITISYISKDTAAAENPEKPRNQDQTDPPEAAATAAASLKQEFHRLDPALIFDESFYPKAVSFLARSGLDPGYLAWLYEYCVRKKPQSLTGFYYKIFCEHRFAALYREFLRSRPPPPDRSISCPVCASGHPADQDCPRCGLGRDKRNDPEALGRHKRLFALDAQEREAYEQKLEEVLSQRTAFGNNFDGYVQLLTDIERQFGLGP
jgi:hypothetical protein